MDKSRPGAGNTRMAPAIENGMPMATQKASRRLRKRVSETTTSKVPNMPLLMSSPSRLRMGVEPSFHVLTETPSGRGLRVG
jgi:hypothetical protein